MPQMDLGMNGAEPNVMSRPPHILKTGVFNLELIVDMVVYGSWMATLCLASFVFVAYGFGNGDLGKNCNNSHSERCYLVFRARATTFVCLNSFALFLAWEMVNFRRSFFRQKPRCTGYRCCYVFYSWWEDSRSSLFLFWAIIAGFHEGITWEWGVFLVKAALFFAECEAWKWAKHVFFRRRAKKQRGGDSLDDRRYFDMPITVNSIFDTTLSKQQQ
ncbi:calcium ATPase [Paraphaeosphaeria sporulosa]|uniref:Calcium ATPase n=1 Tax=Paraphaeosphaeria sporulosa TaxID=1460663 RepID=A0A177BYZ8_9PLEO|nr:calcium ATPase [Paraphaeosphaeria sporulosa]OAG00191.1 calcium ATPase [Paraphaeosphaeria sporulosa]